MRVQASERQGGKRVAATDLEKYAKAAAVCACTNFRKASRAVTQLFDEALQPSGLRATQLVVLLEIAIAEAATVPRLARRLVMDPSTVTRNLKPLEKRGWITSVTHNGHPAFCLTPDGYDLLERAVPLWERTQNQFVRQLGQQNWRALSEGLAAAVSIARAASHT